MNSKSINILVITPVKHIKGVCEILEVSGDVTYLDDPSMSEVKELVGEADAIFTNPNKSNIYIGDEIFKVAKKLSFIATASTGTVHIDIPEAKRRGIKVISLTEERATIDKISSTAEHAFALTLTALRNIPASIESVREGEWDYEKFIGRQMDHLTVGIVGFGRLGGYYAKYARAFGARILVYDPHREIVADGVEQTDLEALLVNSDVVTLHVHVSDETRHMINEKTLSKMKSDVLLVNTSRGEICNEPDLINFLFNNPHAKYATDVLAEETTHKATNPLLQATLSSKQLIITPHIGGMTVEGQEISYTRAAQLLREQLRAVEEN